MRKTYDVSLTDWTLGLGSPVLRHPARRPALRHADFEDKYDFSTVFYDCFWSADGKSVLLIGPALQNLADQLHLRFFAMPSGKELKVTARERAFINLFSLAAPSSLRCLRVESTAGTVFLVPQPNLSMLFDGRRVLMTLSQNNELEWIRDWIIYHQRLHGCDAALIYDNNSTRYDVTEINECLSGIEGVTGVALTWPYRYGPFDGRLPLTYDLWEGHFCQFGMLEHARYRFLSSARCSLNLDIDELVMCPGGESICDLTENSTTGHLKFGGKWVEPLRDPQTSETAKPLHRHYRYRKIGRTQGCENKYTVVPSRIPDSAQFGVHDIFGHAESELADGIELRHFKALNTNWTVDRPGNLLNRTEAGAAAHGLAEDAILADALDRAFENSEETSTPAQSPDFETEVYRARCRASRMLRSARPHEAERAIKMAMEQAPDWPSLKLRYAMMLESDGKAADSEAARVEAQRLQDGDGAGQFDRGRYLLHTGDCLGAAYHFHRAYQIEPRLAVAYAALGRLYWSAGRQRAATNIVSRGLKQCPSSALLHSTIAEFLSATGRNEIALSHVDRAIGVEPRNTRLLILRSKLLRALDREHEALTTTLHALELQSDPSLNIKQLAAAIDDPFTHNFPDADAMMAQIEKVHCLIDLHQLDTAEEQSKGVLTAFPNRSHAHELRYLVLDKMGKADEATVHLERALQLARRDLARLPPQTLGRYKEREWYEASLSHVHQLLLRAGCTSEATLLLEQGLGLYPESYRITTQLVYLLTLDAQFDKLKQAISNGLERFPRDPHLLSEKGRQLENLGKFDEAIDVYRRAIRLGSKQAWLMSHLAHLLIERSGQHPDDLEEAHSLLRQALVLDDKHALTYYRIGDLHWRQGRSIEALASWRIAARFAPGEAWLLSHLGGHLTDNGELEEAMTALETALSLQPDDMLTHYRLGRLHEANGDLDQAIAYLEKAVALNPNVDWTWRHLGDLLTRVGRKEESERAYQHVQVIK